MQEPTAAAAAADDDDDRVFLQYFGRTELPMGGGVTGYLPPDICPQVYGRVR